MRRSWLRRARTARPPQTVYRKQAGERRVFRVEKNSAKAVPVKIGIETRASRACRGRSDGTGRATGFFTEGPDELYGGKYTTPLLCVGAPYGINHSAVLLFFETQE